MRHTNETRKKLSDMRKGANNPFFGKKHTPETRAKLAKVLREYSKKRTYEITPPTVRIPDGANLPYVAGLIDGEGSIRFKGGRPFIAIYNGDVQLKDWLGKVTGIEAHWTDKRGRVPGWQWLLQSAANVYIFCRAVRPFLIVKAGDADAVVGYLKKKYGKRLRFKRGRKDEY